MINRYDFNSKSCRWCGIEYRATKPIGKDGFCSAAHKQAHWRAFKKYVTAIESAAGGSWTRPGGKK